VLVRKSSLSFCFTSCAFNPKCAWHCHARFKFATPFLCDNSNCNAIALWPLNLWPWPLLRKTDRGMGKHPRNLAASNCYSMLLLAKNT
jgi:hypothetical protein